MPILVLESHCWICVVYAAQGRSVYGTTVFYFQVSNFSGKMKLPKMPLLYKYILSKVQYINGSVLMLFAGLFSQKFTKQLATTSVFSISIFGDYSLVQASSIQMAFQYSLLSHLSNLYKLSDAFKFKFRF